MNHHQMFKDDYDLILSLKTTEDENKRERGRG